MSREELRLIIDSQRQDTDKNLAEKVANAEEKLRVTREQLIKFVNEVDGVIEVIIRAHDREVRRYTIERRIMLGAVLVLAFIAVLGL